MPTSLERPTSASITAACLTSEEIRGTLAYLNAQPYTAKVAKLRAALTTELAKRQHTPCPLCGDTGRINDDVQCTRQHCHQERSAAL